MKASEKRPDAGDPFGGGAVVVLTLAAPREKFWGALLGITPAGVTFTGIDLNSFDDFVRLLKSGERATATTLFFPMHRVERIEVDAGSGELPSLGERFERATGQTFSELVGKTLERG